MTFWKRSLAWLNRRQLPVIFLVSAAYFAALAASPHFADPDAYYHAAVARQVIESGPLTSFPWLPFSTLATTFADQHLLYHLLLVPFVVVFGPLVGVKVASVIFATVAMTALAWAIRRFTSSVALACLALLPLAVGTFTFRLGLPKAGSLAVVLFAITVGLTRGASAWPLFVVGFIHVWTHGSWPLGAVVLAANLIAAAGISMMSIWIPGRARDDGNDIGQKRQAASFLSSAYVRRGARQLAALLLGNFVGLVVNPGFPANLQFFWDQTVQVALVGYAQKIAVGIEWYPYRLGELLSVAAPIFLFLLAVVAVLAYATAAGHAKNIPSRSARGVLFTLALAAVLSVMTLRQRRHVEYLVPALVMFGGALCTLVATIDRRRLWADLRSAMPRPRLVTPILVGVFALTLSAFAVVSWRETWRFYHAPSAAWTATRATGRWLDLSLPSGAVVFHDNWADFPSLMYFAPRQRYLVGLDPTFTYRADPHLYGAWQEMATGEYVGDLTAAAQRLFGTNVFVVRRSNAALYSRLFADPRLTLAREDERYAIFVRE